MPGRCSLLHIHLFLSVFKNALFCALLAFESAVRAQVRLDFALFLSPGARAYKSEGRGVNFLSAPLFRTRWIRFSLFCRARELHPTSRRDLSLQPFFCEPEQKQERAALVNYNWNLSSATHHFSAGAARVLGNWIIRSRRGEKNAPPENITGITNSGADANSGCELAGIWELEVIPMHVSANSFLALEHTSASKNRSGRTEHTKPSHVNQSKIRKTYKNSYVVILFIAAMRQW